MEKMTKERAVQFFSNFLKQALLSACASSFGEGKGSCRWVVVSRFELPSLSVGWRTDNGAFADGFKLPWWSVMAAVEEGDLRPEAGSASLAGLSRKELDSIEDAIQPILEHLLEEDINAEK